jgi:hypothetical protein
LLKVIARPVAVAALLSVIAGTASADAPDVLPPAPAWHGGSEKHIVAASNRWITPAEKTAFAESPTYADTITFLRKVDQASKLVSLHVFGKSGEGRDLYYALARKPGAARPVVVVQAGIHAGEIDGKDAGLMLLRDIAFRGRADLLDHVDLVFIPFLNADGHENASELGRPGQRGPGRKGSRTNAAGLDLNRDYARLASPEVAAVVRLLQQFDPDLYIDVHASDGPDYQYDVTYTFAGWGTYARSPATAGWLMGEYSADVNRALAAAGHMPDVYPSWIDENAPWQGLRISAEGPRYSTGYGDFIGIPTVLVENHRMKPYRQRVLGTYVLIEQSLQTVGRAHERIALAKSADRTARPGTLMVKWERDSIPSYTKPFKGYRYGAYDSPASGTRELRWTGQAEDMTLPVFGVTSTREVAIPRAWWILPHQRQLIEALRAHGIRMEVQGAAQTMTLEMARGASGKPGEPLQRARAAVTLPAGAVRVSADQPLRLLAAALLEPESDDSFFAQGRFAQALAPETALPRHLLAPLADKLLANDPALQVTFNEALRASPGFAADPQARLLWLFARSPYADRTRWTYPVLSERD